MEKIKHRVRYLFTCDGGVNPSHHQPKNIEIQTDNNGEYSIWGGCSREPHNSYESALAKLRVDYTFVRYDSKIVSISFPVDQVIQDNFKLTN